MQFPKYRSIDLSTTPLKWGYYVPGLIQQHRPDIELIGIGVDLARICDSRGHVKTSHDKVDYSWLPEKIEQALARGQKVGLLVEDEHVFFPQNQQLTSIVNHYQDQAVYWLSEHDQDRIKKHYQERHQLQCKMLELPWGMLNECLMYNNVKQHGVSTVVSRGARPHNKFFTLTGRYEPFRKRLLEKLIDHGLGHHGLLTIQNTPYNDAAYDLGDQVTVEPHYPYGDHPNKMLAKMAAQFEQNNHWISCNTQNFLHIEQTYCHYPLTIIPETFYHDYFATEKSVWPILLGKMFLILGSQGCMQNIQRFYDVDMSKFLNLEFDYMPAVTTQQLDLKIDHMLASNREFILNAHQVYNQRRDQLQAARNTLGPHLYRFVQAQIARIQ